MDSKFGPSKLLVKEVEEDEDEGYDEVKEEILQEPEAILEELIYVDYEQDFSSTEHVTRVCQSDQQSSQEQNPNDMEMATVLKYESKKARMQPYIDYSKSLLLMDSSHIQMVKDL